MLIFILQEFGIAVDIEDDHHPPKERKKYPTFGRHESPRFSRRTPRFIKRFFEKDHFTPKARAMNIKTNMTLTPMT